MADDEQPPDVPTPPPDVDPEPDDAVAPPDDAVAPSEDPSAAAAAAPETERVRVRRAPRFGSFVGVGILIGALLGVILGGITASDLGGSGQVTFLDGSGTARLIGALALGLVGALIGASLALLADRRSGRRR